VFVPCISPANIEDWNENRYYPTNDDYLTAIADAMNVEYRTIVDAGFLVQVDDPRLVSYYLMDPKMSVEDIRAWANKRVDALNHALRGIPTEKIRYHTCYSINFGPRVHDLEVKHIIDILMRIRAGAFSFEASNPRHEHEWEVWKETKLPQDTILIPGVITNSSVLVEHPELVAQRLIRFADFVGRENVIAGTDCGFASFAGSDEVHTSIVWAKMEAMVKGAEIASNKLWGR
jgi:5-methyltetrahydropteroyltriglutamate--homocysteine methyltransferase